MKAKEFVAAHAGQIGDDALRAEALKVVVDGVAVALTGKSMGLDVNAVKDGLTKWRAICAGLTWRQDDATYETAVKTQFPVVYTAWIEGQKKADDARKAQSTFNPLEAARRRKEEERKKGARGGDREAQGRHDGGKKGSPVDIQTKKPQA